MENRIGLDLSAGARAKAKLKAKGIVSPDLSKLKKVKIDEVTFIYVDPKISTKKAREDFLEKQSKKKIR